ncbi:MarR family winged helix-turn-helix transcriptional regulator [Promicromonospora thailandica]|uniref:DNA-binding transcriptional regulator, MarR family n=1 Tax=Promicromonospora thailandica TaxID=765201 RepID=A0A9X2G225_9MICO|nr:MarR family transcriptional regulator [Promicromonospora thailandica]MCP2265627.1 DNA-binding transcriptional regulator, MarR family [Promicromonospora thailandica]BFF21631.1 MarR family winged helix-turn-helix transcriptional regulator [Promicromonospora thailandica]
MTTATGAPASTLGAVEGRDEVRWLTPQENDAWVSLSWLLLKLPGAIDAQLQRDSGLSYFEYVVLASLSMAPGRHMHMSDLAEFANGSLSRLSNVAKRLETRGLLVRTPCPDNARITVATLTDAGMALVEQAAPGHVGAVRRYVFDALDADQVAQLDRIGRAVADRVEPGKSWPPR